MFYSEKPRTVEARKVTADTAAEVAEWCGGMALPDGSVLYKVGDVWLTAPAGHYVIRDGDNLTNQPADDFERRWAPAESE